ncbi:hypothetical protein Noda2021_06350 [Candidatus Dependentiae bacterium Noda2021]|nr:hypothetical protein Noda2021_06350 [Candidatus Dependentiae bacterium Noda2021]
MIQTERINNEAFHLNIQQTKPTLSQATVVVPAAIVDALYSEAIKAQQSEVHAYGFLKGNAPIGYIEQNFKQSLLEHVKEFLLRYFIAYYLLDELVRQKILIAGEPRFKEAHINPGQDAQFHFEFSVFPAITFQDWKYFPFKAPKRKNYKDLDRQVESFIEEEQKARESHNDGPIAIGDWVNFVAYPVTSEGNPFFPEHTNSLWLKMGDEEVDRPFHELFLHKKKGDSFATQSEQLHECFSSSIDNRTNFLVTIQDTLPHAYFCIDNFKYHFKLKTNKEVYQKLIEVFSYRNDLSQRRAMVEESLKLLLSKHRFDVPNYLVLRQQNDILSNIQNSPDFYVYRVQKDFNQRIYELALKHTKEKLLLDQLAYDENLTVTHQDIKAYLNMLKRKWTKEFIYFDPLQTKVCGQEFPINASELARICSREKTINHIIYHLTKK